MATVPAELTAELTKEEIVQRGKKIMTATSSPLSKLTIKGE